MAWHDTLFSGLSSHFDTQFISVAFFPIYSSVLQVYVMVNL